MDKLSEILIENEEIISDVNAFIKELKNVKTFDKDNLDKNIKKCQDLLLDVDEIIEVIMTCKKEHDPTLATFDADKKSSHAKSLKAKKTLEENLSKLEKLYKKNFNNSNLKEQVDPKKVKRDSTISVEKSDNVKAAVGESISKIADSNEEEKIVKDKNKKKSAENKKTKKNKSKNKEEKADNVDKEESTNKDEKIKSGEEIETSSTKNPQKSKNKGILKTSSKRKEKLKDTNKPDDENQFQEVPIKDEPEEKQKDLNVDTVSIESEGHNLTNKNSDEKEIKDKTESNENFPVNKSDHEDSHLNANSKSNENTNESEKSSKKNKKQSKNKKDKGSKIKTSEENKIKLNESEPKDSDKTLSEGDTSAKTMQNKNLIVETKNEVDNYTPLLPNEASETTVQSQFSSKAQSSNNFENPTDTNMLQIGKKYVLTESYSAEEDDDLSGVAGEELILLDIMEDDWCFMKNIQGETGYVPKSYLKKIDDILVATRNEEKSEMVSNTLEENDKSDSESKIEESADSWVQIKQFMQEKTLNDVLKECGNLPLGFRYSTISKLSKENSNNSSFIAYLCPRLSESHLNFCELQVDQTNSQQKIQRQLQLIKVFQLPHISEKFIIISRHVRLCLFDGTKVLSNIHLIHATVTGKNLSTWNFNLKVNEDIKSVEFGEVFFKFNQSSTDLSILMEFCIQGFKTKLDTVANIDTVKTISEDFSNDELIEFSIGWTTIPLYESNGQPISTKKGDYVINGGTPFEKGLEVDPLNNKADNSVKSKFTLNQNRQPYVTIRLNVPNKENKELIEILPSMIIGSTLHLVLLSFYRRILAESILDAQRNLTSTKSIYSPFLVSFVEVVECPVFLDILRNIWNEKLKTTKDINKKDQSKMNEFFQKVYMDFIYPVTKLKNLPNYNISKENMLQSEEKKLHEIIQKIKMDMTSILVSEEHSYAPLQFSELDFNIMSRYTKS